MDIGKTVFTTSKTSLDIKTRGTTITAHARQLLGNKEWRNRIAQVLRIRYFWGLVLLGLVYVLYVYMNHLAGSYWLPYYNEWRLTYTIFERILFLIFVVLSSRRFKIVGGITACLMLWLFTVIHDLEYSARPDHWLSQVFTLALGLSTAWLFGSYVIIRKEQEIIIRQLRSSLAKGQWIEARLKEVNKVQNKLRIELESMIEYRTEFTRMLVHELKTPLTPLLVASEILANTANDSESKAIACTINEGATDLNKRVDELMDLAKGEIGSLKLDIKTCDLSKILSDTINYMSFVFKAKNQTFVFEAPNHIINVKADALRIRQVLINLLDNASKFTLKKGTVIVRVDEEPGGTRIEIEDTGLGIPAEEQSHIFERYRVARSGNRLNTGMGLGLSLAKMLVDLHGGKIWVRSGKIKGSVFGFSLPTNGDAQ